MAWAIDRLAEEFPGQPIVITSPPEGLTDVFQAVGRAAYRGQVRVVVAESANPILRDGRYGSLSSAVSLVPSADTGWSANPAVREDVARRGDVVADLLRRAAEARDGIETTAGHLAAELRHLEETGRLEDPADPCYSYFEQADLVLNAARAEADRGLGRTSVADGEPPTDRTRLVLASAVRFNENGQPFTDYCVLDGEPAAPERVVLHDDGQPYRAPEWGTDRIGGEISGWNPPPRARAGEAMFLLVGTRLRSEGYPDESTLQEIKNTHYSEAPLVVRGRAATMRAQFIPGAVAESSVTGSRTHPEAARRPLAGGSGQDRERPSR